MRLAIDDADHLLLGKGKDEAEQSLERMAQQIQQIEDTLVIMINTEVTEFYNQQTQLVHHLQSHLTETD